MGRLFNLQIMSSGIFKDCVGIGTMICGAALCIVGLKFVWPSPAVVTSQSQW